MSKVLLIEDDKKLSTALRLRLQHMSYDVISVTDAISAMDAAIKNEPNFILLDINLPGGNGFVVAERLRGHHSTVSTPIIFITASSQPEFAEKASEVSRSAFLQKPFDANQLMDAIDACVGA